MLCSYGCGQEAKHQLKNKKFCCSVSHNSCPSRREKTSITGKGKNHIIKVKPIKVKIDILCSYGCEKKAKYYFSTANKYCCSESKNSCEECKKINKHKNKNTNVGKIAWNKGKVGFISENGIISKRNKMLYKWREFSFIQKQIKSRIISPNKPEKIILSILNDLYPLEWKFTGDFTFWVDGKNPDFLCKDKNLIIEHFGEYYHKGENPKERQNIFKKNGYESLVIWESELRDVEKVKRRIKEFYEYFS